MGFFKKIGGAVKKGLKQVSFKNLVKIGTPFLSMIPFVGGAAQSVVSGMSEAHAAKKQAKQLEAQGKIEEANAMYLQSQQLAMQSGATVGQQAGGVFKAFAKGTADEFVATMPNTVKEVAANAGVTVVDLTINGWFKKHWAKLVGGFVGLVAVVILYKKLGNPKSRSTSKYSKR
jgi:hypothetical protein